MMDGWDPKLVWALWKRENLALAGNRILAIQPAATVIRSYTLHIFRHFFEEV
jgi:hypothetical protein